MLDSSRPSTIAPVQPSLRVAPVLAFGASLVALAWPAVAGVPSPTSCHEASRVSMACTWVVRVCGDDRRVLPARATEALDEADRIDRLMSHYRPDSLLSRLNREAAWGPVPVDRELVELIAESLRLSRESEGAFDITVGPLMKAWGLFEGGGRVPGDAERARALAAVGSHHVILDLGAATVRFDRPGVALDLGGIAKGHAVDRIVSLLRRRGVTAALVNGGGSSIYGLGAPPGGDAWEVKVLDPVKGNREALTVSLRDQALSVTGRGERRFERDGVVYGHVMDPRHGIPVQGVLSVAVLSDTATEGDALGDAFFVQGLEWTRAYVRQNPSVEAFFFEPEAGEAWSLTRVGR